MSIKEQMAELEKERRGLYDQAVRECEDTLLQLRAGEAVKEFEDILLRSAELSGKVMSRSQYLTHSAFSADSSAVLAHQGLKIEYFPFSNLALENSSGPVRKLPRVKGSYLRRYILPTKSLDEDRQWVRIGDVRDLIVRVITERKTYTTEGSAPETLLQIASRSTSDNYLCNVLRISSADDLERTIAEIWEFGLRDLSRLWTKSEEVSAKRSLKSFLKLTTDRVWYPGSRVEVVEG